MRLDIWATEEDVVDVSKILSMLNTNKIKVHVHINKLNKQGNNNYAHNNKLR